MRDRDSLPSLIVHRLCEQTPDLVEGEDCIHEKQITCTGPARAVSVSVSLVTLHYVVVCGCAVMECKGARISTAGIARRFTEQHVADGVRGSPR